MDGVVAGTEGGSVAGIDAGRCSVVIDAGGGNCDGYVEECCGSVWSSGGGRGWFIGGGAESAGPM